MSIPFLSFDEQNFLIGGEIKEAFQRVYDSKWYILGKELKEFEENYAKFNQVEYCIGVANGLDALQIGLKALKVGAGDEVIVPSNTYIATWLAISYTGAKIIPVEPEIDTFNIDPENIYAAISKKTKLIMPVHLFGHPCKMDSIMTIARDNGLFVLEDNAQAHGAKYRNKLTGSFGEINATSFYPTKNLGAFGDAGALTTNDPDLANKAYVFRNYGSEKKYHNTVIGVNSRLDEIQAAFLSVKLNYLEKWTSERQRLAQKYNELLAEIKDLRLPNCIANAEHVYHLYVIRTSKRDLLQQYLKNNDIETAIHYPIPPHLQMAYDKQFPPNSFPIAEQLASTSLSLPLYPGLRDDDLEKIATTIRNFYE